MTDYNPGDRAMNGDGEVEVIAVLRGVAMVKYVNAGVPFLQAVEALRPKPAPLPTEPGVWRNPDGAIIGVTPEGTPHVNGKPIDRLSAEYYESITPGPWQRLAPEAEAKQAAYREAVEKLHTLAIRQGYEFGRSTVRQLEDEFGLEPSA